MLQVKSLEKLKNVKTVPNFCLPCSKRLFFLTYQFMIYS